MSKRRQKELTANESKIKGFVRECLGHSEYEYPKPKYTSTRRLKCDKCKKTWKLSDSLNYSNCPSCKEGRLS